MTSAVRLLASNRQKDEVMAELAKCTKPELIALLLDYTFGLSARDVRYIRGETLHRRGRKVMDEAMADMDRLCGDSHLQTVKRWMAASARFDRGMALCEKADELKGYV